jgi:pimeloyl-ACP methyl ester carboxylesterase
MASFGEEGFAFRRKWLARPLLEQGIGVILPENPFYGSRRAEKSKAATLDTLGDFWSMATVSIQEARSLLSYLAVSEGYDTCGIAGISMGGNFAAIVAAMSPRPVAAALVIPPHSPAPSFTRLGLRGLVDWNALSVCLNMDLPGTLNYFGTQMELADVSILPVPACPEAAIITGGIYDGIVDPESSEIIHRHWPGSTLRWVSGGHVSSVLFNRSAIIRSVADSVDLLKKYRRDR